MALVGGDMAGNNWYDFKVGENDQVGRFMITPGQSQDRADITRLGFGRVTMELHILDEPST